MLNLSALKTLLQVRQMQCYFVVAKNLATELHLAWSTQMALDTLDVYFLYNTTYRS